MPIAMGRIRSETEPASSAKDRGMIAAAPKPCTARATTRASDVELSAAPIEPMVKTTIPAAMTRRRPSRSPSVAAGSMKAAKASV